MYCLRWHEWDAALMLSCELTHPPAPPATTTTRPWSWPAALPSDLGLLYRVAPQRELRSLEMQWSLPNGKMRDARCVVLAVVGWMCGTAWCMMLPVVTARHVHELAACGAYLRA